MDEQIKQITEIIEDMSYDFGSQNMDGVCCENISHGEYRALRTVSRTDKCTMQDIAKSIAVTKSGATRIVSRLEEKKLVHRINDQNDGRVCCVQLSEEGKSLISRLAEEPAKRTAAILSAMTPDMRQILLIGLRAFVETALNQAARGDEQQKSVKVIGATTKKG
jgi:DNA-binding MarR family transcriptional regulator